MISNPAMSYPATVPRQFTLNDLRVRSYAAEEKSSNSALGVSGMVLVAVLAIGAFVMLDPLALFVPSDAKPAASPSSAFVPATEPARPAAMKEIIVAQPAAVPAMKSIEEPVVTTPVVQAPRVSAPAVRHSSSSITPKSRSNPAAKTDSTVIQASPEEKAVLPLLLTKPEEKMDAPIAPNRGDDIKDAPKPAATIDQPPTVKEEAN